MKQNHFYLRYTAKDGGKHPCGVVAMYVSAGLASVAVSLCSPRDHFDRQIGISKAYGRICSKRRFDWTNFDKDRYRKYLSYFFSSSNIARLQTEGRDLVGPSAKVEPENTYLLPQKYDVIDFNVDDLNKIPELHSIFVMLGIPVFRKYSNLLNLHDGKIKKEYEKIFKHQLEVLTGKTLQEISEQ